MDLTYFKTSINPVLSKPNNQTHQKINCFRIKYSNLCHSKHKKFQRSMHCMSIITFIFTLSHINFHFYLGRTYLFAPVFSSFLRAFFLCNNIQHRLRSDPLNAPVIFFLLIFITTFVR